MLISTGQNQIPASPKAQFGVHFHAQTCGKLVAFVPRDEKSGRERDFLREGWINLIQYIAFIYFPYCLYTSEEVRKLQTPQLGTRKATE